MASSALAAAQKAIYARFDTQWGTRTPVSWPNTNFTPPRTPTPGYWVELEVLWGDALEISQGAASIGRNTIVGVIHLNVYGPRSEARGTLMGHADAARNVFNRVEFSGVRCRVPSAPKPVPAEGWDRLVVTTGFTVDEQP